MKKYLPLIMLLTVGGAAHAGGLSTRHQSSLQLVVEPQVVTQTRVGNSYSVSGTNVITSHTPAASGSSAVDGGLGINTYSATTGQGTVGTISGVQNGCTGSSTTSGGSDLACTGSFSFAQSWQQGDSNAAASSTWGDITTYSGGTAGAGKPGTITNAHVVTLDNGSSGSGTIAAGNSLTGQFVSEVTIFD